MANLAGEKPSWLEKAGLDWYLYINNNRIE